MSSHESLWGRWLSLIGICAVTALVWLGTSDIIVALPQIGRDLGGSMDALQWTVNVYFLAGALMIVLGRLADLFGRRLVFAIGTVLMLIGSVIAALSEDVLLLILGRVVQGVGAAAILPAALAIVAVSFSGRRRGTAIGAWVVTCWGAQAVGPVVGGLLIALASWQSIFWLNVPIGLAALLLMWATTEETTSADANRHVDLAGAVTLVAGVAMAAYGFIASDSASPSALALYFLLAAGLLGVFVAIERHADNPIVPLPVFRRARFVGAALSNFIANFIFGAVLFFMALYLQVVEGRSAFEAGALLLPATVPILLLNPIGTRLGLRLGPRIPTAVGMVLMGVATALLLDLSGSYTMLIIPFTLLGAGIGLLITPCADVAVEDPDRIGEGVEAGVYKAASMIGGAFGVALGTAVFQARAHLELMRLLMPFDPSDAELERFVDVLTGSATAAQIMPAAGIDAQAIITRSFDIAVSYSMVPSAIAALVGVGAALLLLRGKAPASDEM